MKKSWKTLGIAVLIFLGILAVLNFDYLKQNITYTISQPQQEGGGELGPLQLSIPSLGISAPIVAATVENEAAFQAAVAGGVGHYPGTAWPGEPGNVYLFGHSSDVPWSKGQYKTIFAILPRIEVGASVFVSNEQGEVFEYKVFDKFVAENTDTQLLDQYGNERKLLTLQTSWPIGTALRRYIVLCELK